MFKSTKTEKAVRRFAALTLAFLMVFQYTASGLSVYSWAEDDRELAAQEEQTEKEAKEEVKEEPQEEVKSEPKEAEVKEEAPAPAPEPEPQPEEQPKQEEPQPEAEEAPAQEPAAEASEQSDDETQPEEPAQEEEQEEPEEEEEEEKFPAQNFVRTVSGVVVRIEAPEGALPEGADVKITPVAASAVEASIEKVAGEDIEVVKAMDITFKDKEGKEVEPEKKVSVNFEHEDFSEIQGTAVYHIEDSGKVEKLAGRDVATYGDQVSINAKDFSIYVVVGDGEDEEDTSDEAARLTVKFYRIGESDPVIMYVKNTDTAEEIKKIIYDPGIGTIASDEIFKGWEFTDKGTEYTQQSIAAIRSYVEARDILEGDVLEVRPSVYKVYRVTYLDEVGATIRTDNVEYKAGQDPDKYTVAEDYTPKSQDAAFRGWYTTSGTVAEGSGPFALGQQITVTGNVVFTPDIPEGYWLSFDGNGKGATYTSPQFIKRPFDASDPDTQTKRPADPQRLGYTFGGWYENAECTGDQFTFGGTIEQRVTLYAKWTPISTARYTIIIWRQNLAGDDYDFVTSVARTGNVNTTVNTVSQAGTGNDTYIRIQGETPNDKYHYTGFHIKEYDQNVTIVPEGTAVVNVYYDRNQYTLTFQDHPYSVTTGNNGTQHGIVDSHYVLLERHGGPISGYYWTYEDEDGNDIRYNGTRYTRGNGWETVKTVTRLYGQSIADIWPIESDAGIKYDQGERWDPQNSSQFDNVIVFLEIMPSENITFRVNQANYSTKTMTYYVEALPGETVDRTYQGRNYTLYNRIYANLNYIDRDLDWLDLTGYTKLTSDPTFPSNGRLSTTQLTVDFYYTRNMYTINYMDGAYKDGDGNDVQSESSRGQLHESDDISYGANLASYNKDGANFYEPEYEGFVFEGWYLDDACTQPYTFTTMPEGGITVYAKWRQIQYRVFLHPNATGDNSFEWGDANQSRNFRKAIGDKIDHVPAERSGYELIGWYLDSAFRNAYNFDAFVLNDDITSPYDKSTHMTDPTDKWGEGATTNADVDRFWITRELNLYAKWRSILTGATGIKVTYDANGGTFSGGSDRYNDPTFYLDRAQSVATFSPSAPSDDVEFEYWVVQEWDEDAGEYKDTDTVIYPGDSFEVLKSLARVEDVENPGEGEDTKKYTMQIRAQYEPKENVTKTHIYWYGNGGQTSGGETLINDPTNLLINEAFAIKPASTFTREGYKFIGWARIAEPASAINPDGSINPSAFTQDDSVEAWLEYDGTNFKENDKVRTRIAADERDPYHVLYAVWEKSRELKITVKDKTSEYSGAEQSGNVLPASITGAADDADIDTDEYKIEGLAEGDVLTVTGYVPSKGTNVGTYENGSFENATITITRNGTDVTSEYSPVTTTAGKLTITRATITVKADDKQKVYGDEDPELTWTATGFKGSDTVALLTDVEIEREEGEDVGEYLIGVAGSTELTNYTVTYQTGTFTITPKEITVTITGNNAEKVYTGSEQEVTGFEYTVTGAQKTYVTVALAEGKKAEAKGTDVKTTDDGKYMMELTEDHFTITPTSNYTVKTVTINDGWLKITPKTITVAITGNTAEKEYTGSEQEVTGYTYTVTGAEETDVTVALADGKKAEAKGTDVKLENDGKYMMGLDTDSFTVTPGSNYVIAADGVTVTDGWLKITPKAITVTIKGNQDSVPYDGETHTTTGWEATPSDTAYNKTKISFTGVATASRKDFGKTNMNLKVADFSNTDTNYNVTFEIGEDGYQEITRAQVTVKANDATKVYDNDPTNPGTYTADVTGLIGQDTIVYTVGREEGEDVDEYTITPTGDEFQGNYIVTYQTGTFTITPKEVTVKADNATKVYDNDPSNPASYTATVTGTLGSDTVTYTVGRTAGEDVGEYTITPTGDETQGNYKVKYETGIFTITPKKVTVTADNNGKLFGEADPSPLTATVVGTIGDDTVQYSVTRDAGEAVGTYAITASGETTQGNYTVEYKPGVFTISRNTMEITASGYEGEYDAEYHTGSAAATVTEGTTIKYSTDDGETWLDEMPKIKDVGKIKVKIKATNPGYEDATAEVTLKVTPKEVTVTANDAEKTYGDPDPAQFTATPEGVIDNYAIVVSVSREPGEDAGEYAIIPTGEETQGNYTVKYVNGKFTVKKAALTVTADNKEKTYGDPDPDLTWTATGFKNGDSKTLLTDITISREGYDTVGEHNINVTGPEAIDNYTIEYKPGILTIKPKTVTVTANNDQKVYGDSDPQEFTAAVEGLIDGDEISYTVSRAAGEDVGEYTITPTGDASQGNYTVEYKPGKFTITPKAVTVKANDTEKVYDNDPSNPSSYEAAVEGLKDGDQITYTVSRAAGEDVGEYTITPTGDAAQGNYTVRYETGTFTITPVEIVISITGNKAEKTYNGETQKAEGFTAESDSKFFDSSKVKYSGGAVAEGKNVSEDGYPMNIETSKFSYDDANVKATFELVEDGKLTIRPLAVTVQIEGKKDSKTYNGKEQSLKGYEVTSISSDLYKEEYVGCEEEPEAKGTDAGKYTMALNEASFYNADESGNFDVTFKVSDGEFEIRPLEVTIEIAGNTASEVYDGKEHAVEGYEVKSISSDLYKEDDFDFEGEAVAKGTDAGTYPMGLKAEQFTNKNDNFKATFNVTDGSLIITAKDTVVIRITGKTDTKVYDGSEQSVSGYDIEIPEGVDLTKDDIKYDGKAEAKGKDAGTYPIGLDKDKFSVDSDKYDVEFQVIDGSLTIAPAEVKIIADDKEITYGQAMPELTATVTGLIGSDKIDYELSVADPDNKLYNAGKYTIAVSLKDEPQTNLTLAAETKTVGNYTVTTEDGTLTIDKAALKITTGSAEKEYDGEPLTKDGADVEGLQNDEQIKVTVTGSQTEVGSSRNTFEIDWQQTNKDNYELTEETGTLTVTSKQEPEPEPEPEPDDDDDDDDDDDEPEEEGEDGKPEPKKGSPIKTGDENALAGWLALMLAAGAGTVVMIRRRRSDN